MSVQRKSRSIEEYAYAAMSMLGQITIADTDETTVVLPSAWLREMQRWEHRIVVGSGAVPRRREERGPVAVDDAQRVNAAPDDPAHVAEVRDEAQAALGRMSKRERHCIEARYGLDGGPATLRAAGEAVGVSRERARQIQARAEKRAARRTLKERGDPREKRT